uniref:Putative hydrolase n=1 Tax=Xenopsylla cheopis TaxID=163159 RepID=A0A6M2DKN0_XENCH
MEQKVKVKDMELNYVKSGKGQNAILLMPGLLGSAWTDFKPQIENLPALITNSTVIAWDPPGYGASRPPNRKFDINFFHNDSELSNEFMKTLGHEKYSILGWSDGGITGMISAGKYTKAVQNLVIWGANAYIIPEELKIYESIRDIKNWSKRMREPLEKLYGEEYFQNAMSQWVDAFKEMYNKNEGNICREYLSKIECPTFIVHGAKDPMISSEHVPYLNKNIKGSKLYIFEEGKHNVHLRYPEQFNNMVADFFNKKL